MKTKFGPNFQGLPFQNHPKESLKLKNRWLLLRKFYENHMQRRKSRKDEKSKQELALYEEKLRQQDFFSPAVFPGLLAEFSQNPPRNPQNPP